MKTLTLARKAGPARIRIVFGQAQFGTFRVMLARSDGEWDVIGKGSSNDPPVDIPLGDPVALKGRILRWDLVVTVLKVPGQYQADVTIAQQGSVAEHQVLSDKIETDSENPAIAVNLRKVVVA